MSWGWGQFSEVTSLGSLPLGVVPFSLCPEVGVSYRKNQSRENKYTYIVRNVQQYVIVEDDKHKHIHKSSTIHEILVWPLR